MVMTSFQAWVVDKQSATFTMGLRELQIEDLPEGEVLIRVQYSSLNYKDGLACSPNGGVIRNYPQIPGIDLAGIVVASQVSAFEPGQQVLVTGYGLGVSHFGGFSQMARVPAQWVVPLPPDLEPQEAMLIGTAGLTAAISIEQLERSGLTPTQGPVLVTGATGGVGSFAVAMLAARGYEVIASTGKADEHAYLEALGACKVIDRQELARGSHKPLEKQTWAAAIDSVGGSSLAYILASLQYGGAVAVCGLTGGAELPATVHPFIMRAVQLLGVDSVSYPAERRYSLWQQIACDVKQHSYLKDIAVTVIGLEEVPWYAEEILKSHIRGRVVIQL